MLKGFVTGFFAWNFERYLSRTAGVRARDAVGRLSMMERSGELVGEGGRGAHRGALLHHLLGRDEGIDALVLPVHLGNNGSEG